MKTQGRPSAGEEKPQTREKHPKEWRRDLNPDYMAGQNIGRDDAMAEHGLPTAYDVKELHRVLARLPDDVLKQIPVLPSGARLQQGAGYLDLADPGRREFTATGHMRAEAGHCLVPKDLVPFPTWNQLVGGGVGGRPAVELQRGTEESESSSAADESQPGSRQ